MSEEENDEIPWKDRKQLLTHLDWGLEGPIENAIALLQGYVDAGWFDLSIDKESDYEGGYYIVLTGWREKTDAEKREDAAAHARYAAESEARDRATYEALKRKYETRP